MYKITIEKFTDTQYNETERIYVDENGHETKDYDRKYSYSDKPTGRTLTRRDTRTIFTQEVDNMNMAIVIKAVNQMN